MENAADALKIGFALLVFATAITVLFMLTSKSRTTADAVFYYGDETNYHAHTDATDTNRVVSVADVITTLYRYNKESLAVTIKWKDGSTKVKDFDLQKETNENTNVIENEVGRFIVEEAKLLDGANRNKKFLETFVEVPTSGIYLVDNETGTDIALADGSKKIFITYEETDG